LLGIALLAGLVTASPHATQPPALVRLAVPGYGVTVAVPSSWSSEPPPARYAKVGLVRFFRARTAAAGFRPNLNLIVLPLAPAHSLREWLFSGASASLPYVGKTTPVTFSGVHGLHYESTKEQKAGDIPLLTDQYAFVRGSRVYLFTYSSPASSLAAFAPLFAASARTIRFVKPGLTA
jgi:hypothetical protein